MGLTQLLFVRRHRVARVLVRVSAAGGFREAYVYRGEEPVYYFRDIGGCAWHGERLIVAINAVYGDSASLYALDPEIELASTIEVFPEGETAELVAVEESGVAVDSLGVEGAADRVLKRIRIPGDAPSAR